MPPQAKARGQVREQEQQLAALRALIAKQREAQQEDSNAAARQVTEWKERYENILLRRCLLQEEVIAHLKVRQSKGPREHHAAMHMSRGVCMTLSSSHDAQPLSFCKHVARMSPMHAQTIAARDAALERLRADLADAEYEVDQLKV